MNCLECSMRYVCETLLGGKDKCAYNQYIPIVGGTSDSTEVCDTEDEDEDD